MLSATAANIARVGIMFDFTGDDARPFPFLPDAITGDAGTPGIVDHLPYGFPVEDFPGWMVVATSPRAGLRRPGTGSGR